MSRLTKEQAADIDYLRAGIMSDYAATGGAFGIERTRAKRIVSMLEAMIDELAARWQPIETAPRDGTRIIVSVPRVAHPSVSVWVCIAMWHGGIWRVDTYGGYEDCECSDWMPLPEPPQ